MPREPMLPSIKTALLTWIFFTVLCAFTRWWATNAAWPCCAHSSISHIHPYIGMAWPCFLVRLRLCGDQACCTDEPNMLKCIGRDLLGSWSGTRNERYTTDTDTSFCICERGRGKYHAGRPYVVSLGEDSVHMRTYI
ncbi:hypothetical protein F4859DRAFT_289428 [Xylaria cf. heliscus]|nr:hypothetical protein F4859DRAFT_289428 [Xylaria cf. heliscus]